MSKRATADDSDVPYNVGTRLRYRRDKSVGEVIEMREYPGTRMICEYRIHFDDGQPDCFISHEMLRADMYWEVVDAR